VHPKPTFSTLIVPSHTKFTASLSLIRLLFFAYKQAPTVTFILQQVMANTYTTTTLTREPYLSFPTTPTEE